MYKYISTNYMVFSIGQWVWRSRPVYLKSKRGTQASPWLALMSSATSNDCQGFVWLARVNPTNCQVVSIMTVHLISLSSVVCFLLSIRDVSHDIRHTQFPRREWLGYLPVAFYTIPPYQFIPSIAKRGWWQSMASNACMGEYTMYDYRCSR